MAKRLTDTNKWKDEWYISLSNDYRIIWQWLLDNCDHAGICKRSMSLLNRDCNVNISEDELLEVMRGRVLVSGNNWFIPKFLRFQYPNLNSKKPVIVSAVKELEKNGLTTMIPESFGNDYLIIKSKSKSIVSVLGNDSSTREDELVGKIPGKPMGADIPEPSADMIQTIRERQYGLGNSAFTPEMIRQYWSTWVRMEYTGATYVSKADDVHQHFARHCNRGKINFVSAPTGANRKKIIV